MSGETWSVWGNLESYGDVRSFWEILGCLCMYGYVWYLWGCLDMHEDLMVGMDLYGVA